MANYNPNSVWGSKQEKFEYKPPEKPVKKEEPSKPEPPEGLEPHKRGALFWIVTVVVVLGACAFLYFYFLKPVPAPSVSIDFTTPPQVLVGQPFPVTVSFSNYSSETLQNADLSLSLPDNVSFAGESSGQRAMEQSVGAVGPGSINNQVFNLIVTGNPNSLAHIVAEVSYSPENSPKSQFSTSSSTDVLVDGSAVSLNITSPTTVFSGQTFTMTMNYVNNTNQAFPGVIINMQYPPAFNFLNSSIPSSDETNDSWSLGSLAAGASGSFTITGNLSGPSAGYPIMGTLTGNFDGDNYSLTNQTANVAIASSPLSLSIALNGSTDYITKLSDNLDYTLTYTNNSNITFQNLNLQAKLAGSMFNFSTVEANGGSFSSLNDTLSWNAAGDPTLASLGPGDSGSVNFEVTTKSSYPIKFLSDKDFAVQVSAQVESPTVPQGTAASTSVSTAVIQTKVGGEMDLSTVGYHKDPQSSILNTGPYPPQVNQPTQYTIHWILTNYSTDMDNVTVSAPLESGTTCTGQGVSNVSSTPTCDPESGLVTWQIPFVPATAGVIGNPVEAVFQVTNTPAVNEVGGPVTLLGQANMQATDAFTSLPITGTSPAITTDLPEDTSVSAVQSRSVQQ